MPLSNHQKSLGWKTKKEIKNYAPKDAEWCDFEGNFFFKVVDNKVFSTNKEACWRWIGSGNTKPSILIETYFYRLKK